MSVGNAIKGFATYGCFHPCLYFKSANQTLHMLNLFLQCFIDVNIGSLYCCSLHHNPVTLALLPFPETMKEHHNCYLLIIPLSLTVAWHVSHPLGVRTQTVTIIKMCTNLCYISIISRGNALAQNRCNSLPCTVRFYRQRSCNERIGCLKEISFCYILYSLCYQLRFLLWGRS